MINFEVICKVCGNNEVDMFITDNEEIIIDCKTCENYEYPY